MTRHLAGVRGETYAISHLVANGYDILCRNYRTKYGEIDIIAEFNDTLHFIEVKTWRSLTVHDLEFSIDRRKKNRILSVAKNYILKNGIDAEKPLSFDVIFSNPDRDGVRHFVNAYSESG
jgi:putative endonuclease